MDVISFEISGKFAFFRNNENNQDLLVSYGQIHKLSILGALGSILGYDGHTESFKKDDKPEFYKKLKNIKVAIVPISNGYNYGEFHGIFDRIAITTNNTAGFNETGIKVVYPGSKKEVDVKTATTLQIKQQMLVNPKWKVFLDLSAIEEDVKEKIKSCLLNNTYTYLPYLGRKENFAYFTNVKSENAKICLSTRNIIITGLCKAKNIDFADKEILLDLDAVEEIKEEFYREELLPYDYNEYNVYYKKEIFALTNRRVDIRDENILTIDNCNYCFY